MIRISFILIFFMISCASSKSQESEYLPSDNWQNGKVNNQYLNVEYFSTERQITEFLLVDFDLKIGYYSKYDSIGNLISKGTLDVNSFDSINGYSETIFFAVLPFSGMFDGEYQTLPFMKTGKWVYYYPDNKVQIKGEYLNNLKHGVWYYYNLKGSIMLQRNYSNGAMISEYIQDYENYFIPPE